MPTVEVVHKCVLFDFIVKFCNQQKMGFLYTIKLKLEKNIFTIITFVNSRWRFFHWQFCKLNIMSENKINLTWTRNLISINQNKEWIFRIRYKKYNKNEYWGPKTSKFLIISSKHVSRGRIEKLEIKIRL